MNGTCSILSVGGGDVRISFDPKDAAERIRAARIVADMLRRGYALLVETKRGGKVAYQRVKRFDEKRCEYIIADLDSEAAATADAEEKGESPATPTPVQKRSRVRDRAIPAEHAKAVAVARSAGG